MQYEDIIWKSIFELLQDDGLKFFGIEEKIVSPVNIELIEFQSGKTKLSRFMVADAILAERYDKDVRTVIIYTADIEQAEHILKRGSITYEVENFYMYEFDGDKNYEDIKSKLELKQPLNKQDLMRLCLLPLMKNKEDTPTVIEKSVELSKELEKNEEQQQIQAMLYLFAEKFIKDKERLSRAKERFAMTALGQMLVEDKAIEIAKKLLKRGNSLQDIAEDTGLDLEKVKELANSK